MTEGRKARRQAKAAGEKKWRYVQCPNFIRMDPQGAITDILCKVCGTTIAGFTEETTRRSHDRAGTIIETKLIRFARFQNYAELKIEFKDGSAHTTNLCTQCVSEQLEDFQLRELFEADINFDPTGYTERDKNRKPRKVAAIARNAGGLT